MVSGRFSAVQGFAYIIRFVISRSGVRISASAPFFALSATTPPLTDRRGFRAAATVPGTVRATLALSPYSTRPFTPLDVETSRRQRR